MGVSYDSNDFTWTAPPNAVAHSMIIYDDSAASTSDAIFVDYTSGTGDAITVTGDDYLGVTFDFGSGVFIVDGPMALDEDLLSFDDSPEWGDELCP